MTDDPRRSTPVDDFRVVERRAFRISRVLSSCGATCVDEKVSARPTPKSLILGVETVRSRSKSANSALTSLALSRQQTEWRWPEARIQICGLCKPRHTMISVVALEALTLLYAWRSSSTPVLPAARDEANHLSFDPQWLSHNFNALSWVPEECRSVIGGEMGLSSPSPCRTWSHQVLVRSTFEQLVRGSSLHPSEFHRLGRFPLLAKSMMIVAEKRQ